MTKNTDFERVVFQPNTYQGMQRGINQIANAFRLTLGTIPRNVAIAKPKPYDQTPEMLDRGGLIAQRIQQIPDRDEDVGAMLPSPIPSSILPNGNSNRCISNGRLIPITRYKKYLMNLIC